MMNSKTIEAIRKINPDAQCQVAEDKDGNLLEPIVWLDGTTPISEEDIQAKKDELAYQYNRKEEYPTIEDQLDDIYHNGIDGWKTTIKVTKDKYPKP